MLKKSKTNARELKRKSVVDKKFKLKLSKIYSQKLSKFNLEKQLNTIHKRKHVNYISNKNIAKNLLNKIINSQSDSNGSDKYEKLRRKN